MVFDEEYLELLEDRTKIRYEDLREIDPSVYGYDGIYVDERLFEEISQMSRADGEPHDELGNEMFEEIWESIKKKEPLRDVSKGMQVHYNEQSNEEVHDAIKEVLGADDLNDSSKPSSLGEYDLFRKFKLKKYESSGFWRVPRFKPTELFEALDGEGLGSNIIIVLLVFPVE